jgi:hypothetical protein
MSDSGFRRGVNENFTLLECYTMWIVTDVSGQPISDCMTIENETDSSTEVDDWLPIYAAVTSQKSEDLKQVRSVYNDYQTTRYKSQKTTLFTVTAVYV